MKFLSNFDTSLRDGLLKDYQNKFWKNNVTLVRRSKIFLFLVVLSPLVWMLFIIFMLFFLWLLFSNNIQDQTISNLFLLLVLVVWSSVLIATLARVLKRFRDYTMDYAIITPEEIVHYNQQWLITRQVKTMDMEKVKTVNVQWWWWIQSIFNYWTIVFLSEWDSEFWDLVLSYVHNPMHVKKLIMDIKSYWESLRNSN